MTMICQVCQGENETGMLFCQDCGATLSDLNEVGTIPVNRNRVAQAQAEASISRGSDALCPGTRLILQFDRTQRDVEIDLWAVESVLLGRLDPDDITAIPKIDLTPFGGRPLGVSRRHARLDLNENAVYLSDLQSTNGSFANNCMLEPAQPQRLCDGDAITLGRLSFRVVFQAPDIDR